jgi:hypothetical protein
MISLYLVNDPLKSHLYFPPHFADRKTASERLSELFRVTQLLAGRPGVGSVPDLPRAKKKKKPHVLSLSSDLKKQTVTLCLVNLNTEWCSSKQSLDIPWGVCCWFSENFSLKNAYH